MSEILYGGQGRGLLNPEALGQTCSRATKYLRYVRPPPNFYNGVIDFYKVRVEHMRPGNPEGDMPKDLSHLNNAEEGVVGWSHPIWGPDFIDKVYPNRTIDTHLKLWYNTPWLWSPFTDMFSSWFTNCNNRCGKFELEALECMEYYGLKKGKIICKDIYEDFMECRWKRLESKRNWAMKTKHFQRYYEYKNGKREWDTVYIPVPKAHAFEEPAANPRYNT